METNYQLVHQLFDFIECSPTSSHTTQAACALLGQAGFTQLSETEDWGALTPGGKYYVTRSMSSVIAFKAPKADFHGFSIVAPHGDSPCFQVKGNPEMKADGHYTKLNTEIYGGTDPRLWLDRPLSVAGRVILRTEEGVKTCLVDLKQDLMLIPSLAPHMGGGARQEGRMDPQRETLPLLGKQESDLLEMVAKAVGAQKEDILSWDLYLYNRARGVVFGADREFLAAPKLDDLECAFAAIRAFIDSDNAENCTVCAVFDNEETGSSTRQGANSTFLSDVLTRICRGYGHPESYAATAIQRGFLLSADNAHAAHPNYPEKTDPTSRCYLNGGPVIKFGAGYATDGITAGVFKHICQKAGVPVQVYYNHSNIRGGGTLGKISGSHVSIPTVDIGVAQLAMHSPFETGGAADVEHMVNAMSAFYQAQIVWKSNGECVVR